MILKDNGTSEYETAPSGSHVAICYSIIDIGTQRNDYQGEVNYKRQVIFHWELCHELMTGKNEGRPFSVMKFYTASLNEKANLRIDLKNWRGRDFTPEELMGFDAKNILGKPCILSVTLSDKGKAKVTGVTAMTKGTPVQKQVNPSVYFSLDSFDKELFESLPDWLKEKIKASPEYASLTGTKATSGSFSDFESDLPF